MLWLTYLLSRFSSSPFLCKVAMKSVKGRVIRKVRSRSRPLKTKASSWETGTRPNSLVAFAGPHSPLAQSGNGTMTVCKSWHRILNLQTLLNFMGSPVKYSWGVTALAKMSNNKAPLHGACTLNATTFPTTDWWNMDRKENKIALTNCSSIYWTRMLLIGQKFGFFFNICAICRIFFKNEKLYENVFYLHNESLEADTVVVVLVVSVELEVVMEDEAVLHVTGHL